MKRKDLRCMQFHSECYYLMHNKTPVLRVQYTPVRMIFWWRAILDYVIQLLSPCGASARIIKPDYVTFSTPPVSQNYLRSSHVRSHHSTQPLFAGLQVKMTSPSSSHGSKASTPGYVKSRGSWSPNILPPMYLPISVPDSRTKRRKKTKCSRANQRR